MTILVTGGAGYIGSVVVAELVERGHRVVVLDNLSSGHLLAVPPEAEFLRHDLADRLGTLELLDARRIEAVMHFAAHIQVGESMLRPLKYVGDNVRNALNLLECMLQSGVNRFIFSSTAAIFAPSETPIAESATIGPGSPYGESKYMIERALRWLDETTRLRYVALRYFNAAGAWRGRGEDHPVETHLIPLVLEVAGGRSEAIDVFGDDYRTPDGTCVRDYIHVTDLAEAHLLGLEALRKDHSTTAYNMGNGSGYSVLQVIRVAEEVTGKKIDTVPAERRPGDPAVLVASSEKITKELGFQARYPDLKTIVETAWRWHSSHPMGYGI